MRTVLAGLLVLAAAPLAAQSVPDPLHGAGSPSDIQAGTYLVEPHHTQVTFAVSHLGISPFSGTFSNVSGSLSVDPAHPAAARLVVAVPMMTVHTTSDALNDELKGADWLDAAKYPEATFQSTSVTRTSPDTVQIEGMLTMHGVTKPELIQAHFFGAGTNPMSKKASIGFIGRMPIKRSDFGIAKDVPLVSDETVLVINAAFEKP